MRIAFGFLVLALLAAQARGDGGVEFFEKKVRPVLAEHCYSCHSASAKKKKGSLLLDTREGMRKGGDSGPAIVPGKPGESLFLRALRYTDDTLKMPPKSKLPDAVIADLEAWVKMGAPDPRDGTKTAAAGSWEEMLRTRRQWWSLQPVRKPTVPPIRNPQSAIRNPIDAFILARLEAKGLAAAEAADPRTLIRRLSLVLTGLPPSPQEVEEFVKDAGPQAVERLADRLLASPHFGERWARHWMDVVRFSETHGNEWNYEVHHAWRYRDYLIRAFNEDVPYDQFVREHLAGDLLRQPRRHGREGFNESVIGTAFYRFGEANHDDCISLRSIGYDLADNQIDTLSKAFQATTVACARCHDHKIDAVSMKDYHALLAVVRSSRQVSHTIDAPDANGKVLQQLSELKAAIRKELGEVWVRESREVGRYLLAAQARCLKQADAHSLAAGLDPQRVERWLLALQDTKAAADDPLRPWRAFTSTPGTEWRKLADQLKKEDSERSAFNEKNFIPLNLADWQTGGQGLRTGSSRNGEIALATDGETLVCGVLPAGYFTHTLSDKLNGTLRSPVFSGKKKYISVEVLGQRSSAFRLVSNNCQLNYKNYRALTSNTLQWVTFELPEDRDSLRTYAELMTMLDNPKFPDQLSALGGDTANYRLPWEQAARNPRSFFGITRAVLHDTPEPLKAGMGHLLPLFAGQEPRTLADAAGRYAAVAENAVRAWTQQGGDANDVRWVSVLLGRGLLSNKADLTPRLASLVQQYRQAETQLSLPSIVPGLADFGPGADQPVFVRGDCTKPGETVPRRYLEVLSKSTEPFPSSGSGRLELAEQIANPANPLTARVMVNRVWHHLFGTGLVRTVDDFGRVGELPSHPELLDYLAARFVEDGWSVKRLIRSIVLTRTFQMANRPSALSREVDPDNRLLQHYPARRMEAEAIRDGILAASGRLSRELYGHSIPAYRETANADRRLFPGPLDGNGRRSVYIKNTLMEAPRFLSAFDFPGGKVTQGRRDVTNVPAQGLALLNDPFVLQQADVWSRRLIACKTDTSAERVVKMFRTALGRDMHPEDRERFMRFVSQVAALHNVPPDGVLASAAVWRDVAHTMFNLQEFTRIP